MNHIDLFFDRVGTLVGRLPTTDKVLAIRQANTAMSFTEASIISNVPVARSDGQTLASLQATNDKVFDLETQTFYRNVEGSWETVDVATDVDEHFTIHTLLFSPYDRRFYYVQENGTVVRVNTSA